MKRVKKFINSMALLMLFSMSMFSVASAQEDVDFSQYGSKEETVKALEGEGGGETGELANPNDGSLGELKAEEPPIPTLENSTEVKLDPTEVPENVNTEEPIKGEDVKSQKLSLPYLLIVVLAFIALVALVVSISKKGGKK